MANASTYRDLILRKVGADGRGLKPEDYVTPAIRYYEQFFPRVATFDVDGNGTSLYEIDTTQDPWTLWEVGFSRILQIEYPVDEEPAAYLDLNEYRLRDRADSGDDGETRNQDLVLRSHAPGSADDPMRVQHTARHAVTATTSTVPASHDEAIGDLGASLMLEDLAQRTASLVSQTGMAVDEVVPYTEMAEQYRASARAARRRARIMLGLPADEGQPGTGASTGIAVGDFDFNLHAGMGGLTRHHRRR